MEIQKETFIGADEKTRHGLTYDMFSSVERGISDLTNSVKGVQGDNARQNEKCVTQVKECDGRFKKIEYKWAKLGGVVIVLSLILPFILKKVF